MNKKYPDLTIEIKGGSSYDGSELAKELENFCKKLGFGKIKVTGVKENMFGWDGLSECESVEIVFTNYPNNRNIQ